MLCEYRIYHMVEPPLSKGNVDDWFIPIICDKEATKVFIRAAPARSEFLGPINVCDEHFETQSRENAVYEALDNYDY